MKAFGNSPNVWERKSEIGDCERFALAIPNFASFPLPGGKGVGGMGAMYSYRMLSVIYIMERMFFPLIS